MNANDWQPSGDKLAIRIMAIVGLSLALYELVQILG